MPSLLAHPADATQEVKLYLNRGPDGGLTLSANPPSARNSTAWQTSGTYYTSQGLRIEIPLVDPNPNWVIDEDAGVQGWVSYSFQQMRASTLWPPITSHPYGYFAWIMLQGERATQMHLECVKPNETRSYACDETRYVASFPGHGGDGAPHTHGDGSDAERGLMSGDLEWRLTYTIPPCTTTSYSFCGLVGTTMRYDFRVLLDGTTFLRYVAVDEQHPLDAPATPVQGNATDNETVQDNATEASAPEGNETSNQTGSGAEGSAYRPAAYQAIGPEENAPGAGLAAILSCAAVGAWLRRRR